MTVAAARSKRAGTERTEMAQKPATNRNTALAMLASKGMYRDLVDQVQADTRGRVPVLTGRVYDLGGTTEGVLLAPWFVAGGRTVFRGDVVRADAKWFEGHEVFAVLGA